MEKAWRIRTNKTRKGREKFVPDYFDSSLFLRQIIRIRMYRKRVFKKGGKTS